MNRRARGNDNVDVLRLSATDRSRVEECARLMVSSEPWITLRRSFDSALAALQDSGKEVHIVLDAQGVVAFIILDMRGPLRGYIQTICVRPDYRGGGVGTALIRWAEQRVARESPNVFLCVSSFNVAARRLYERLGYEVVGTLRGFIVPEHDELLLRKTQGPWAEFQRKPDLLSR
jgi:ribosomal protein S18 acetylase RimI-like enzyme